VASATATDTSGHDRRGVKDFHFTPLRQMIEPLILVYYPPDCNLIVARLKPGDIPRTIGEIEKSGKNSRPAFPFRFMFPRGALDNLYRTEERTGTIIGYLPFWRSSSPAWAFRPASFTAERRRRRSASQGAGRHGPDDRLALLPGVLEMVLAANVIACPWPTFAVSKWLEGYPTGSVSDRGPFLFAGGLALLVAALTRLPFDPVARANPSGALRYE